MELAQQIRARLVLWPATSAKRARAARHVQQLLLRDEGPASEGCVYVRIASRAGRSCRCVMRALRALGAEHRTLGRVKSRLRMGAVACMSHYNASVRGSIAQQRT